MRMRRSSLVGQTDCFHTKVTNVSSLGYVRGAFVHFLRMPKYYCDYCDTYLTHDSPSVRKTHCQGRKHKDNVKFYYQKWMEEQAQHLIDATTAAFKAGKISHPFAPKPGAAIPPPANMQGPPRAVPPGPLPPGPNMMGPGPMAPMGPMMMGPNGPIRGPMGGPIMGPMGPMMGPMGPMGPMMGPMGGPMMGPMRPMMGNMQPPNQPPRVKEP